MKDKETKYYFSQNLVLRTPAEPLCSDAIKIRTLIATFSKANNKEALFLSSPGLHTEHSNRDETKDGDPIITSKIDLSLLKYHQRIKHRCTPFGLFAACSVLSWGNQSSIEKNDAVKRSTRLDMHYSVALAQHLTSLDFIKSQLRFFPNTSLYQSTDKLRFTEYYYKTKNKVHQLSEVDFSTYLEQILDKAENGEFLNILTTGLVSDEITEEMAAGFINELATSQILVSELEPSVSGRELLSELIQKLNKIDSSKENPALIEITLQLELIQQKILELDQNEVNEISKYAEIIELLKYFPIEFDESKLFQVDLFAEHNDSASSLDKLIQSKLLKTIEALKKLHEPPQKTNLTEFKDAFYSKYEDAAIPLLEAMDNEKGIGYGRNLKNSSDVNSLLEGIGAGKRQVNQTIPWSNIQNFLTSKLILATKENRYSISFTKKELEALSENNAIFCDSHSVMFSVISNREEKSPIFFKGLWGPSATVLLGRFASGNDQIKSLVDEIASNEERLNPEKILAEIAHLPENRTGNVLLRPQVRKFEIPYLSGCNVSSENQIKLQDLYVKVKDNKIILWSAKHQKEILPRMSNAHNYSANALPVYHFLCDLQSQNILSGLSFNWGNLQEQFTFLPRAVIEDVIVFPATWQFRKSDYEQILNAKKENQVDLLFEWKAKWNIPDRFYIADGDNELVIHLHRSEELLIELFLSELKNRNTIILKEFLFDLENPLIKNSTGEGFTNEFVASLIRESKPQSKSEIVVIPKIKRTFVPGSEWLYYKIYCGTKTADRILLEIINPLCEELLSKNLIEKWFFIRYTDPDHHLRIRFFSSDPKKLSELTQLLHQAFKDSPFGETAHKIQTDTYQRELERYGDSTMELAEDLFFEDSKMTLELLNLLAQNGKDDMRWLVATASLNALLDSFELTGNEKIKFLETLSENFRNEFGFFGKNKIQIDQKYRLLKKQIEDFLDLEKIEDPFSKEVYQILEQRTKKLNPIALKIKSALTESDRSPSLQDLMASYAHMVMNRVFRSNQRMSETLIYDFLWRYWVSVKAKAEKSTRNLKIN